MRKNVAYHNLIVRSLICLILFAVIFSYAKDLNAQTLNITDLKVEGNIRVAPTTVLSYIMTQPGDGFDAKQLNGDLKRIYESGLFVDVTIKRDTAADGVTVTFIVQEKPVVKEVTLEGNEEVASEELTDKLTIENNQLLSSEELTRSVDQLKDAYAEKGYFITDISYEIKELDDNGVEIIFNIKENLKVQIKKINFIGNHTFDDEKLKTLIQTDEGGYFSGLDDSGTFKEDIYSIDIERIKKFYKENGFIKVDVKTAKTSLSTDKTELFLTVQISEGKLYRVGTLEIKGEDLLFTKEELIDLISLAEGDVFNETKLLTDILSIKDKYTNLGYAYANVYPETNEDSDRQRVSFVIHINKNELVYFNEIKVTGNKSTRDKVVRRELKFFEGELYSKANIIKSREKLFYLGYFSEVNILTKQAAGDKMDLEINVMEKSTGSLNIGGGYSSHDKAMAYASISKGNFRGLGQTISFTTELSDKKQLFSLGFTEPWLFDIPLSFSVNLYNSSKEYIDYTKKSTGGSVRVGYPLFEEVRGYVRYGNEEVEITDLEAGVAVIIADQEGFTTTSSMGLTLQRDTRNNRMDPSGGSISTADTEYAGGFLGGDNFYTKYRIKGSKYFNPWSDHVIMLNGRTSYAHGNEGRELPVYERYYLGGINSLRGFDYNSVGPKDPLTGDVIGGDKEVLFNFEYTFYLVKEANFKFVTFFDTGNAFDIGDSIDLSNLRQSVGYGIRWISPIGPLRLEWGLNLDPLPDEAKSQWEFTIGTFF